MTTNLVNPEAGHPFYGAATNVNYSPLFLAAANIKATRERGGDLTPEDEVTLRSLTTTLVGLEQEYRPDKGLAGYSDDLMGKIQNEAEIENMRYDAFTAIGPDGVTTPVGRKFFENLTEERLRQEGARKAEGRSLRKPSKIVGEIKHPEGLFDFLDGDNEAEIATAKANRKVKLACDSAGKEPAELEQLEADLAAQHRAKIMANRLLPGVEETVKESKIKALEYIADFLRRSTIQMDLGAETGGGENLALRAFLAPVGNGEQKVFDDKPDPANPEEMVEYIENNGKRKDNEDGGHRFNEQYNWDTYPINEIFMLLGGHDIAFGQIQNLVDAYAEHGIIPNALIGAQLSHNQQNTPIRSLLKINKTGQLNNADFAIAMEAYEQDLLENTLDAGGGLNKDERQKIVKDSIGPLAENNFLSRYASIHKGKLHAGLMDGEDHNEITIMFGEHFIPVKQGSVTYGTLNALADYYSNYDTYNPDANEHMKNLAVKKSARYKKCVVEMREQFNRIHWEDKEGQEGYKNFALEGNEALRNENGNPIDHEEGRIFHDSLSAEAFPLAYGLPDEDQAKHIRDNIMTHFLGDRGLATTNPEQREGSLDISHYEKERSDDQWRKHNVWPPLMQLAIEGLEKYGYQDEADHIRNIYVAALEQDFEKLGFFAEKTISHSDAKILEGMYGKIKGGFGWTVSIYAKLLREQVERGHVSSEFGKTYDNT